MSNRPAENTTAALAAAIAAYLGVTDPSVIALIVLGLGLVPHIVTAIVNWRRTSGPAPAPTVPPVPPPTRSAP